MVEKAKKSGMKHLAITDNGTLFGVLHFYRECRENNINPIIGCEFQVYPKEIKYPDPSLENNLKPTYGIIVYQEQVMEIIGKISDFSMGKADILHRAIRAKKVHVLGRMKAEFLNGALQLGYSSKKASDIFEMLVYFSVYTFNKSHSASYTMIAYKTAYLKAHYPEEFKTIHCNKTESYKEF